MVDIIKRSEWGATPSKYSTNITPLGVVYHWNGPEMGEVDHDKCDDLVRQIEKYHEQTRGWADIAYSLIVCSHGSIYEGRGVGHRSAANGTNYGNQNYYAIMALRGEGDYISDACLHGLKDARTYLMDNGAGARVRCHGDLKSTACPGPDIRWWVEAGMPIASAWPGDGNPSRTLSKAPESSSPSTHTGEGSNGPENGTQTVSWPIVGSGDRGHLVEVIQALLNVRGNALVEDGLWGPKTETALKAFQSKSGLKADGICGASTWPPLIGVK